MVLDTFHGGLWHLSQIQLGIWEYRPGKAGRVAPGHGVLSGAEQKYRMTAIWVDICSSVLPSSAKKAAEQALARKGGRGEVGRSAFAQWCGRLLYL